MGTENSGSQKMVKKTWSLPPWEMETTITQLVGHINKTSSSKFPETLPKNITRNSRKGERNISKQAWANKTWWGISIVTHEYINKMLQQSLQPMIQDFIKMCLINIQSPILSINHWLIMLIWEHVMQGFHLLNAIADAEFWNRLHDIIEFMQNTHTNQKKKTHVYDLILQPQVINSRTNLTRTTKHQHYISPLLHISISCSISLRQRVKTIRHLQSTLHDLNIQRGQIADLNPFLNNLCLIRPKISPYLLARILNNDTNNFYRGKMTHSNQSPSYPYTELNISHLMFKSIRPTR